MLKIPSIVLMAALLSGAVSAQAVSAQATYQAFMTVTGKTQGAVKGSGKSKSNKIPIVKFSMITTPKKQDQKTVTVVVEGGEATGLTKAASNNELLPSVMISVLKDLPSDKVQVVERVELMNAVIKSIKNSFDDKSGMIDTIVFTYEKLEDNSTSGPVTGKDDWTH